MTTLDSKLNSRSEDFKANAAAMQRVVDDLKEKVAKIALGGGDAARDKHLARGKLLPRDRVQTLLDAGPESGHPMDLPLSEGDRKLLASVLMNEEEDLTPELLEGGVNALRRNSVRRRLEQVQRDIVEASRKVDAARVAELTAEKLRLKRLLGAAKMASDAGAAD